MARQTIDGYEAPTVVILGSVEELTRASTCGATLDASFPAGTAFGDITCS